MALLSKAYIIRALERLGELAHQSGYSIELVAVGGAAMVLLYDARPSTHDVDVMIVTPQASMVRTWASQVAQELALADDWLNDGAKGYLVGFDRGSELHRSLGILVISPTVFQLLAMKLSAWRDDVDIDDAKRLLTSLNGSQEEIWQKVQPYLVPGSELKAEYAFSDLWEVIHGAD